MSISGAKRLKLLDVWDATAKEFFDLTVVTLTILRRTKCTVERNSVGVIAVVKGKVKAVPRQAWTDP
jgi:hypothetical protein